MSDYTPTTREVRAAYGDVACVDLDAPHDEGCEADRAFDRWLAQHDREVAAKAVREFRIRELRAQAADAAEAWREHGKANDLLRRDHILAALALIERGES